jgi:hypothetical protein
VQESGVPGAFTALSDIKMDDKEGKHIVTYYCELVDLINITVSALGLLADTSFDYYMKLVPTIYEDLSGEKRFSYQYTFANKV